MDALRTMDVTTTVTTARNECTAEQGAEWQAKYSDGYRAARSDVLWNADPRIALVTIPPEMPGETGAEYVARHVGQAWEIGYTAGYRFQQSA
jgi:hypothetical protein